MHYDVDRSTLHKLSSKIEELAAIEREVCNPENAGCESFERKMCHIQKVVISVLMSQGLS